MSKIATTQYNVTDLIKNRWSPRSFSQDTVTDEDMLTLLEAASWAPSSNNHQPWRFEYALRGSEGFQTILNTLSPGNAGWAKNAAALVVSIGYKHVPGDAERRLHYYMHDNGMANSLMLIQAFSMGIYSHVMAGFSKPNLTEALGLQSHEEPVVVIALGYVDHPSKLEEPFQTRELEPRTRKSLSELVKKLN